MLREQIDHEMMAEAMVRVSCRVDFRTWEVFRLLTVEPRPVADVAAELRMSMASAYKAKCSVQKMLRGEIRTLEGDAADATDGEPPAAPR